jgi:hypothetical protein
MNITHCRTGKDLQHIPVDHAGVFGINNREFELRLKSLDTMALPRRREFR